VPTAELGVQASVGFASKTGPRKHNEDFAGALIGAELPEPRREVIAAIADGMDVLNLSLGGGYHGNNDLLAIGLDNAVEAGVSVAVAAGNSGPGGGTVESPGRARNVITVGASTNQHFVGQPFTYPAGGGTTVGAAVGDFDALPGTPFNLFDTASNGCTSVPAGASGDLAIINRGNCTFSQKVANAKAAGAIAVLIVNNVAGDPIAMARTNVPNSGPNQFFFNTVDNPGLNPGGFTVEGYAVFGKITNAAGLATMDRIAGRAIVDASTDPKFPAPIGGANGVLSQLPVRDKAAFDARGTPTQANLDPNADVIKINRIAIKMAVGKTA